MKYVEASMSARTSVSACMATSRGTAYSISRKTTLRREVNTRYEASLYMRSDSALRSVWGNQ